MTIRKLALQVVRVAGAVVGSLVLIAFLAVQIQQRLLRWRAERLLADMHQIRLYQSTWVDAQRLMHRWGAWGRYDGSCTSASCKYEIELGSIAVYTPHSSPHAWLLWLFTHDRLNLYEWFGGRGAAVLASFTVHDGTIWRESTAMGVSVPRRKMKRITGVDTMLVDDDLELFISVGAGSHQRLQDPFMNMGSDERLAGHPYYKVRRPDGCKIACQIVSVYYSTHTPPTDIDRLTSYDFSCFTRFSPCARIVDLLPAAEEWHLYDNPYESGPTQMIPPPEPEAGLSVTKPTPPVPCSSIPVWAQARDASYILAVEALSTKIAKIQAGYGEYEREVAKVRVVSSLKEPAPWLPGSIASTDHIYWLNDASPSSEDEYFVPGKRYIVFAIGNDRRDRLVTKDSPLSFERCGVHEDTPEIRRELEKGFAQNDTLVP